MLKGRANGRQKAVVQALQQKNLHEDGRESNH
jgi:hypothetical protein